jgi:hypothetical protein
MVAGQGEILKDGERSVFLPEKRRYLQKGANMITWNSLQRLLSLLPLWQWGAAIVVFALAIWMIIRLRSLFREDADDSDVKLEMLTQFREMYQEGGLSDDEFRLIRSRLTRDAQKASEKEQVESKVIAVSSAPSVSTDIPSEATNQMPDNHATTEKLGKPERISDERTE